MATITARIPDEKKIKAQQLAQELWVSLSTLINMWINDFLRNKKVEFSLVDDTHWEWYQDKDMVDFGWVDAREVVQFLDDQLEQDGSVDAIPTQANTKTTSKV